MNDFRDLPRLLAALAPLGLLTSGCSSPGLGEFTDRVCVVESEGLAELEPADGIDYVALRAKAGYAADPMPTLVSKWGTACGSASDAAACEAALAAVPFDVALARTGIDAQTLYDVIFSRGDDVAQVTDRAALLELLGKVDTRNEAALVAFAAGHELPCNADNAREEGSSYVLLATRGNTCGGDVEHYLVTVTASGDVSTGKSEVFEEGDPNCAIGRRPAKLRSGTPRARSLGEFFANAAHLEAASVHAFGELAGELAAHGAPRRMIAAAHRSRADEIRHTRTTAALARRFGGRPAAPVVASRSTKSLFELALDNATEGCVRETFGALVANVQSMRATDRSVRRELGRIAFDECRHATLSWAIDAWSRTRLAARERRALDEAQRQALAALRGEVAHEWPADVGEIAGMPGAEATARLLAGLDATLWAS